MQGGGAIAAPAMRRLKRRRGRKIERRIGRSGPWEQDEGSPQIVRLPQMRRLRSTMLATTTRKS